MKIGFFVDVYYPHVNGVTVSVDNLANELRLLGHTVYIIAPKVKGARIDKVDKNVIYIPSAGVIFSAPEIRVPLFLPQANIKKVFNLDLDIIHAHGNGAFSYLGYQMAKVKNIPFVLTFHGLQTEYTHYIFKGKIIKPGMVKKLLQFFGNVSDGAIAPSEKMKEKLISFGVRKEIKVIPNFVPLDKFDVRESDFVRQKLSLPKDSFIILSVGRLGKEKNFEFVIKMFKKLSTKEKTSHLVIVGDGTDKEKLTKLAGSLVSKRIHFTGAIDSTLMPKVYKSADIFVFGSITEVHPMVALEAAASGLPLVLAKDSAYDNLVFDDKNGYSLPLRDNFFIEKILFLISNSNIRAQFRKASEEIVDRIFNPESITLEFVDYYRDSIKEHKLRLKKFPYLRKSTKKLLSVTKRLGKIISSY